MPAAALNLLSAYDLQHTIAYHYWIVPAAAVAVAGAVGAGRVGQRRSRPGSAWSRRGRVRASLVLSLQWVSAIVEQIRFEWPKRDERQAVLDAIPGGASVAAPMHALAHLAERETLYVVPEPLLPVRVGTEWTAADRERATRRARLRRLRPAAQVLGRADRRRRSSRRSSGAGSSRSTRRGEIAALPEDGERVSPTAIALIGARGGLGARAGQERPAARRPSAARVRDRDGAPERRLRAHRRLDRQRGDREGRALVRRRRPVPAPAEYATATSPDIEWIAWTLPQLEERYDLFAIVRATNPFRGPATIRRGLEQLLATPEADSIRAVELVKQHPGKMWVLDEVGRLMRPLLDQSQLDVAWHAGQYQALPQVYVQNSALEIAWTRVVEATGTREGRMLAPFLTEGYEGLNIDDEDDFARAEELVASGRASFPPSSASRILPTRDARSGRAALRRSDRRASDRRAAPHARVPRSAPGPRWLVGLGGIVVAWLVQTVVGGDTRPASRRHRGARALPGRPRPGLL